MRRLCLALAALLLTAGPVRAERGDAGQWELGLYGGYGWLDDYGTLHPEDNGLFGARLGYFFGPMWSAEVSGQRLSTVSQFEPPAVSNVDLHLDGFRFNALLNFSPGAAVRPFLTAGLGYENLDADAFGESGDMGWNAGAGLRWFPSPSWNLRLEGRYVGINVGNEIDETQGNVEATLGIGFLFGGRGEEPVAAPPPNQMPSVTLASDRPDILPGETVGLRATATDPDGDPMTYEWSATAGRVTGTGATATLDFEGVTPPASSTVTVRVADSRGGSATASTTVRLNQPARPAEAVSCLAGGFPRNLSRLTNVDKACLDDVAQRLMSDPRARVVVVGHADAGETSAERLGEQRAEAVKTYLVAERRIDAARVTTRSAGATRPHGDGADAAARAGNRRAEVWFVPEGAAEPN